MNCPIPTLVKIFLAALISCILLGNSSLASAQNPEGLAQPNNGLELIYGGTEKFQTDPHWKDCILFYEYFHGDNGAGLGASHQTGWTGVVAKMIELFGRLDAHQLLDNGKSAAFVKIA